MKKRLLLFLCIFTLLLSTAAQAEGVTADVPAPAPSAEKADTLSPFARTRSYDGRFTDVDASAWYHDAVAALYEYGLTEGVSSSAYAPEGSVTIAELVTFAARLHALERGGRAYSPLTRSVLIAIGNQVGNGIPLPHLDIIACRQMIQMVSGADFVAIFQLLGLAHPRTRLDKAHELINH